MNDRYVCTDCGYIYDPSYGDTGSGIKADVPFEELPPDWICPECGAAQDRFRRLNENV